MKAAASIWEALSTGLRQAVTLGAVHFEIKNSLGNVVAVETLSLGSPVCVLLKVLGAIERCVQIAVQAWNLSLH